MNNEQFIGLIIALVGIFVSLCAAFWTLIYFLMQTKDLIHKTKEDLSEKINTVKGSLSEEINTGFKDLNNRLGHVESFLGFTYKKFEAKTGTE